MFFRKKNKPLVSLDLTAIDQRVIARKNQVIDAAFIENLSMAAPQENSTFLRLVKIPVFEHLQQVMEKYAFDQASGIGCANADIENELQRIAFPERVVKELLWMQRFEYVYHHTLAVTVLVAHLAIEIFSDARDRQTAISAALTQDFGMTRIPKKVLDKPGRLDENELKLVREHPWYGSLLLIYYYGDAANTLATITLEHHEDGLGTGYPHGIVQQNQIAQLIRLCDIYDALITARPFRPAMTTEEALTILQEEQEAGKIIPGLIDRLQAIVRGR